MTDLATTTEARRRADVIRMGMVAYDQTLKAIADAYAARDWETLGYADWDTYIGEEFSEARVRLNPEQRAQAVSALRIEGMSQRAIGSALGVSQDTVRRHLAQVNDSVHLPQSQDERPVAKVTGVDGKSYAPKPAAHRPIPAPVLANPEPVAMPARQNVANAILNAIDESTSDATPIAEPEPEHAEADARRYAELDEALAGTAQRFRATFATAMVSAGKVVSFDAERIAEVFDASFDRDVQRPFLDVLRRWCDEVEQAHRDRRKAGLRLVQGGAA